jgi:hypothetical protein
MTVRFIIGIAFFAAAVICAMIAGFQYMEMQHELNARLPEGQKFEPLFWHFGTHMKFKRLQKQFLPESPRPRAIRQLRFAGFACFAIAVALLAPDLWL